MQWLAWTFTPLPDSPYSYHSTEIEARAAAWDRSSHPDQETR